GATRRDHRPQCRGALGGGQPLQAGHHLKREPAMKRPSSKGIVMNLLAALAVAAGASAQEEARVPYQTFKDKAAFLAATGAQNATGELPNVGLVLGSLTVGSVTIEASRFAVGAFGNSGVVDGDWTLRLPGPDIAISDGVNNSATDDLDIVFATPVFAAGFDF